MKKLMITFVSLFLLSGCAKIKHLGPLLVLKDLSEEQEQLNEYVDAQDKKFELLIEEAKSGTLGQYLDKKRILEIFGEPILKKEAGANNPETECWLYRYATRYFGSEKVYLYFNKEEKLVLWKYIEGKKEKGEE